MDHEVDLVIPVYQEGRTILPVLEGLRRAAGARLLLCYDMDDDDTLPVARGFAQQSGCDIVFVKNRWRGPHGAVRSGFAASTAPAVIVFPADDALNASVVNQMAALCRQGHDIVAASRFMPGGKMEGCPWLKALLVRAAAWTLHAFAGVPTRDPTNGFRLFSRRVLDTIPIESTEGFTYSLELLVKCHRLGWSVAEVPVRWVERPDGRSRFRVLRWLPAYLRWYGYAFATAWLRRPPSTVALCAGPAA